MSIPLDLASKPAPTKSSDVAGGYTPTAEERKKVVLTPGIFTLSGDRVFHTIQGEGNRIGTHTTFVRLHFCNLSCSWCDTWYTWRGDTPEYYREPSQATPEELMELILADQENKGITRDRTVKDITFTGGEPMMQQKTIQMFMEKYPDFAVQIETNGTIMPSDFLMERVRWNCSPKLGCSGNKDRRFQESVLRRLTESKNLPCFKFVACNPEDIDEVLEKYPFIPRHQMYIMPEGVTKEESMETYSRINDKLLSSGLNTTPRLQNIMYDGAKRGV